MNLTEVLIRIISSRDSGNGTIHTFHVLPEDAAGSIESLISALPVGGEITVPDASRSECYLELRRSIGGLESKLGRHGMHGSWETTDSLNAMNFLLPGTLSAEAKRSGCTLWLPK